MNWETNDCFSANHYFWGWTSCKQLLLRVGHEEVDTTICSSPLWRLLTQIFGAFSGCQQLWAHHLLLFMIFSWVDVDTQQLWIKSIAPTSSTFHYLGRPMQNAQLHMSHFCHSGGWSLACTSAYCTMHGVKCWKWTVCINQCASASRSKSDLWFWLI